MTFTSYAQNLEDVILWRALGHCSPGRYVDVGAQDPVVDSVGRAFHEAGWTGVHVEPLADYADALRRAFPTDTVIEAVLGKDVGTLTFYELPGGLSTVRADIAQFHQEHAGHTPVVRQVATTTLAVIFELMGMEPIHWLKIDVEGHEREVLEGWGSAPQRPWVVLVESTFPTTSTPTHEMWEYLLLARNYALAYTDGLNRFYLHADHPELQDKFRYPPNVFDDFELNGTATWLTTRLVRQHQEKTSEQQRQIEQLSGLLDRATQERTEIEGALLDLRRQNQIEQKKHAAEVERLRSAGKVSEAMERLARDLENELRALRTAADDAQAHRLLALEKAEIAQAEARLAEKELIAAQAEADRSANKAQAAASALAAMEKRADTLAQELQDSLLQADLLSRQIEDRSTRIAQLEEQLQRQTETNVARSYALRRAKSEADTLARELQDSLLQADLLSRQIDDKSTRIAQLEDQLRRQTEANVARSYALQRAENEADVAKAEAAQLRAEIVQGMAKIGQMEKLLAASFRETEALTEKLNGSRWFRLLMGLGLLRIDTSRAVATMRQASLAIEPLDEQSWQIVESQYERGCIVMSTMLANDINELLTINGSEFIDVAYRTLLKRSPDRAGRDHFLERLRAGHGKEAVILAIVDSPEARALPDTLPGLAELRAREANRRGSRGARGEILRLERTMNRLEFSLGEMHARSARQSDRILERLDLLESRMAAFSGGSAMAGAVAAAEAGTPRALPEAGQTISSLTSQVTETAPDRFIDALRHAVRQSSEAATITASTR